MKIEKQIRYVIGFAALTGTLALATLVYAQWDLDALLWFVTAALWILACVPWLPKKMPGEEKSTDALSISRDPQLASEGSQDACAPSNAIIDAKAVAHVDHAEIDSERRRYIDEAVEIHLLRGL